MPIQNNMSKEDKEKLINEVLDTPEENETEGNEEVKNPEKETPKPEEKKEEPKEELKEPTLETRYKESTRESQVLHLKNEKFVNTVIEANNLPEPTEEELKSEYSEWDDMTPTEQKLAKGRLIDKRKFDRVFSVVEEGKKLNEWEEKIDSFLAVEVNKEPKLSGRLTGKEEDFKKFAMKPSRRGLELPDLVRAYLFDSVEEPSGGKRGSLLETGTGGGVEEKKEDFIDEKQAQLLRTKNHKLYQEMVRKKKIKFDL